MLLGRLGLVVVDQSILCETRTSSISPSKRNSPPPVVVRNSIPQAYKGFSSASFMCQGTTMLSGLRTNKDRV